MEVIPTTDGREIIFGLVAIVSVLWMMHRALVKNERTGERAGFGGGVNAALLLVVGTTGGYFTFVSTDNIYMYIMMGVGFAMMLYGVVMSDGYEV